MVPRGPLELVVPRGPPWSPRVSAAPDPEFVARACGPPWSPVVPSGSWSPVVPRAPLGLVVPRGPPWSPRVSAPPGPKSVARACGPPCSPVAGERVPDPESVARSPPLPPIVLRPVVSHHQLFKVFCRHGVIEKMKSLRPLRVGVPARMSANKRSKPG
jgi:hypothetical protein